MIFNRKFSNCLTLDTTGKCDQEKHILRGNKVMESFEVVTLQNSQHYVPSNYDEPLKNEATVAFHDIGPLSTQSRIKIQ